MLWEVPHWKKYVYLKYNISHVCMITKPFLLCLQNHLLIFHRKHCPHPHPKERSAFGHLDSVWFEEKGKFASKINLSEWFLRRIMLTFIHMNTSPLNEKQVSVTPNACPPLPPSRTMPLCSATSPQWRQADGFVKSTRQRAKQLKWIPAKEICEADDNVKYTFRAFLCGS